MEHIGFQQVLLNIFKNLLLRRVLVSATIISVCVFAYGSYYIFPQFLNQLTDYTEDSAIRVANHLKERILPKGRSLSTQTFTRDVQDEILKAKDDFQLERIKFFSETGEVLFSSAPEDIGKINTHAYFQTQIAKGKTYTKLVPRESTTLEGRTIHSDVVEIYVPLMNLEGFAGAVEVYYDITGNNATLKSLLTRLRVTAGLFSAVFLVIFTIILFKASRNILARDMAEMLLKTAHAELEKKVAERTRDLEKANDFLKIEIEKQKASDLAFRESENRMRTILAANPDPMVVYDLNGHPLYLNPSFSHLFGWSYDELKGQTIPFVPDDQKKTTEKKIQEIFTHGKVLSFETARLTKEGRLLDVLLSAAVIRKMDGSPMGIVVNLTDISGKKALEARYKQAQKLESIGTLAGGIAHDFNNILSGIFGYSQLALMNLQNPEKAADDIGQIVKAAQRAADLVRQILTFSRQSEYKKTVIRADAVVTEAMKLLRSSIPTTIDIQEFIRSRAKVLADPIQLHQVVMNLCTNAYQAMGATGGILTVELNDIQVASPETAPYPGMLPGPYVELIIRDTGCGIPAESMEKIFDPYFTTKAPDKGTGLGLSVVHGIVREHGGFLKVSSTPGVGTQFYVFLSLSALEETGGVPDQIAVLPIAGTECILFVDDEETIRSSAVEFFEDHGYKIACFADGALALAAFKKEPFQFDIVITDQTMPVLTGEQLARAIRDIRPELPVILCSGYSENFSPADVREKGLYLFLQKPVSLETLAGIIRKCLDDPAPFF